MRVALVGLIFFALAATARADTWVLDDPADPEALAPPQPRRRALHQRHHRTSGARRLKTYRAFRRPYDAGIDRIESRYDEASDTAVRDAIADALYVPAARAGLDAETLFDG